jgi:hypothetical protein
MNFQEAIKKLSKLANGKYNSLSYDITQFSRHSSYQQRCTVYVDGYSHYSGNTWEQAFEKLEEALNPHQLSIEDIEPIPGTIDLVTGNIQAA